MGLVHTGIHSRLGVEKVRKCTMMGMDIKQTHIDAGLLCPRGKQSFSVPPSEEGSEAADRIEVKDSADVLNFCQLSEQLVGTAAPPDPVPANSVPANSVPAMRAYKRKANCTAAGTHIPAYSFTLLIPIAGPTCLA